MSVDSPAAQPLTPDSLIEQCLAGDQVAWELIVEPELAQGVQRRLQVRRQARRSGRSHAGHLPQDFQGAGHASTGARTSRPGSSASAATSASITTAACGRSGRRSPAKSTPTTCSRHRPSAGPYRRPSTGPPRPAAAGAAEAAAHPADGGGAARSAGAVVPGDRRSARAARGHGEVADQPRAHRAGAPAAAPAGQAAGARRRRGLRAAQDAFRSVRMNLTTEHANGIAVVRVGESRLMYPLLSEFSSAVHAADRLRARSGSSSTCRRSATSTARPSAA